MYILFKMYYQENKTSTEVIWFVSVLQENSPGQGVQKQRGLYARVIRIKCIKCVCVLCNQYRGGVARWLFHPNHLSQPFSYLTETCLFTLYPSKAGFWRRRIWNYIFWTNTLCPKCTITRKIVYSLYSVRLLIRTGHGPKIRKGSWRHLNESIHSYLRNISI